MIDMWGSSTLAATLVVFLSVGDWRKTEKERFG